MNDSHSPRTPASSPRPLSLARIVDWSQQLLVEVLSAGDTAIDLTAGLGRDTLALAGAVGRVGRVVAFDLQEPALQQTARLCAGYGFAVEHWSSDESVPQRPAVYLVHGCHSRLSRTVSCPVTAIIANLGYLPGSDRQLVTRSETTVAALRQGLDLLATGGRLAVTVYPGHAGGEAEAAAVADLLYALPSKGWQVLQLRVANRQQAPCLLVAERR
ncbi:MAG: class I SAM-dependent methyltransferase [Desulfuromonadales bacterium]|nr:class I SAM-dependent methyltransferase [Desulfuromonadales bacterium]